jgi:hypothetical protein
MRPLLPTGRKKTFLCSIPRGAAHWFLVASDEGDMATHLRRSSMPKRRTVELRSRRSPPTLPLAQQYFRKGERERATHLLATTFSDFSVGRFHRRQVTANERLGALYGCPESPYSGRWRNISNGPHRIALGGSCPAGVPARFANTPNALSVSGQDGFCASERRQCLNARSNE